MAKPYGQYCPVALATEILGERWTILVVMVIMDGYSRFNDMQRALPKISASTLSQRLKSLEDAGVVERRPGITGDASGYYLTDAGVDLGDIIMSLGVWGQKWGRDLETHDLDPRHLIWSIHMRMNVDIMPKGRTTIAFEFSDMPSHLRYFWIVVNDKAVDACMKNPGYEEDVRVVSKVHCFVDAWRGFSSMHEEIASGRIRVSGPRDLTRNFADWLLLSMIAGERRLRCGRERDLQLSTQSSKGR